MGHIVRFSRGWWESVSTDLRTFLILANKIGTDNNSSFYLFSDLNCLSADSTFVIIIEELIIHGNDSFITVYVVLVLKVQTLLHLKIYQWKLQSPSLTYRNM